ncbi:hypothetical protein [Lysobacter fragariae]
MRNLMTALYFALSLFGCDDGGTTVITRSSVDGVDQLLTQTRVRLGVARFQCVSSRSGECHYALFPTQCATRDGGCRAHPIEQFAMAPGDTREVVGLPKRFDLCVSPDAEFVKPDCARP